MRHEVDPGDDRDVAPPPRRGRGFAAPSPARAPASPPPSRGAKSLALTVAAAHANAGAENAASGEQAPVRAEEARLELRVPRGEERAVPPDGVPTCVPASSSSSASLQKTGASGSEGSAAA